MFNKIVSRLNGEGRDPLALQKILDQLLCDRAATDQQIADLQSRRHRALLDDADDKTLDGIERQIARATVKLEKLTLAEQPLRDRLAAAKGAAHQRTIVKHRETVLALYPELKTAIATAVAAQGKLLQAREAAAREIGEAAVQYHLPAIVYLGFLTPDAFAIWVDHCDRLMAMPRATPAGPAPAPVPGPAARYPSGPAAPLARPGGVPPKPPPPNPMAVAVASPIVPLPRPLRRDPVPSDAGELQVSMTRGAELPDGTQGRPGEVITLPAEKARQLVERGAADFVTEDPKNV